MKGKHLNDRLNAEYKEYVQTVPDGTEPKTALAFRKERAEALLAEETKEVRDAVEVFRQKKKDSAEEPALHRLVHPSDKGMPEPEDVKKDINQLSRSVHALFGFSGCVLKIACSNIESLPATLRTMQDSIHRLTGWVGLTIFAGPNPKTGTMCTIS